MTGHNNHFGVGIWFGIFNERASKTKYMAETMPVRWTIYPEDAWMTRDISMAFSWLKMMKQQGSIRNVHVFRCTVEKTMIGSMQVVNHKPVKSRQGRK